MKDEELQHALSAAASDARASKASALAIAAGGLGVAAVGAFLAFHHVSDGVAMELIGIGAVVAGRVRAALWTPSELNLARLLSDLDDPSLLPTLIASLDRGSSNFRGLVRAAVTRLLVQDAAAGCSVLIEQPRMQILLRDIARFRHMDRAVQFEEERFLIAVLETFKARLYLPALAELRWMPIDYYSQLNPRIAMALTDSMTALSAEAQRQAKAGVLLRAADAPGSPVEHLLTPARAVSDEDERQLLRGSVAE